MLDLIFVLDVLAVKAVFSLTEHLYVLNSSFTSRKYDATPVPPLLLYRFLRVLVLMKK